MHRDRIVIKDLHCSIRLGVHKEEQEVRRNCELDIYIYFDLSNAGKTDELDQTVNYSKVISIAQNLSSKVQFKLLESFAYCLFEEIFKATAAKRVSMRVKKLNPPIEAKFAYVGIELTRNREDFLKE